MLLFIDCVAIVTALSILSFESVLTLSIDPPVLVEGVIGRLVLLSFGVLKVSPCSRLIVVFSMFSIRSVSFSGVLSG